MIYFREVLHYFLRQNILAIDFFVFLLFIILYFAFPLRLSLMFFLFPTSLMGTSDIGKEGEVLMLSLLGPSIC